jgi:hypothetical protein
MMTERILLKTADPALALGIFSRVRPPGGRYFGKSWSAFALSYRTFCAAPSGDFRVRMEEIRRDEHGWLKAA